MKILISIGLISIAFALQAQKSLVKYGDIPMDDMTMKQFDKDSSAAAVVLVDYGNAFIEDQAGEIVLTYMRHVRIKIQRVSLPLPTIGFPKMFRPSRRSPT